MAKVQYPNPKFWKAKDNIDWKKQGENAKEVLGIFGDMLKETDWKAFGKGAIEGCKADIERIKGEYKDFMALDNAEKWDRVVNGERSLGRLYRKGAMATVRREWRGVKDTAYDFYEWAHMWGMLLMTFSKDLIPAMNSALWYRWMISYFCCHGFMDKQDALHLRRNDHGPDRRRLPRSACHSAPAAAHVPGLRDRPVGLHPLY